MTKKLFKVFYYLFFLNLILFGNVNAENSKVDEISKNLRCLICQGQSVYDSNSEFALSVKTLISQKLPQVIQKMIFIISLSLNMEIGLSTSQKLTNLHFCYGYCLYFCLFLEAF